MLSRVVELHVDRVHRSPVYAIDVDALVLVKTGLLEIEAEGVTENARQLLSLKSIVEYQSIFQVVSFQLSFKEVRNVQFVKRHCLVEYP